MKIKNNTAAPFLQPISPAALTGLRSRNTPKKLHFMQIHDVQFSEVSSAPLLSAAKKKKKRVAS